MMAEASAITSYRNASGSALLDQAHNVVGLYERGNVAEGKTAVNQLGTTIKQIAEDLNNMLAALEYEEKKRYDDIRTAKREQGEYEQNLQVMETRIRELETQKDQTEAKLEGLHEAERSAESKFESETRREMEAVEAAENVNPFWKLIPIAGPFIYVDKVNGHRNRASSSRQEIHRLVGEINKLKIEAFQSGMNLVAVVRKRAVIQAASEQVKQRIAELHYEVTFLKQIHEKLMTTVSFFHEISYQVSSAGDSVKMWKKLCQYIEDNEITAELLKMVEERGNICSDVLSNIADTLRKSQDLICFGYDAVHGDLALPRSRTTTSFTSGHELLAGSGIVEIMNAVVLLADDDDDDEDDNDDDNDYLLNGFGMLSILSICAELEP